ncbi:MAG: hypothetical protein LQ348_006473 [Seirophora lacunosa]|nr:MAG: hypothetical protein LQ348_006473 [Seirophora lacunosa]
MYGATRTHYPLTNEAAINYNKLQQQKPADLTIPCFVPSDKEPPRKKLHSSTRVRSPPGIVLSSESESKPAKRSSPGGDLSDPGRENSDNYVVVNNPMFDPDGKEIDEPASDGNNELAEEREHEVGFVFQNEFVLPGPHRWPEAAAFIKKDPKQLSSQRCIFIPEIQAPLYYHQWLGAYGSFMMCNSDRNGGIEADGQGLDPDNRSYFHERREIPS